jgi:hypothetical protein
MEDEDVRRKNGIEEGVILFAEEGGGAGATSGLFADAGWRV